MKKLALACFLVLAPAAMSAAQNPDDAPLPTKKAAPTAKAERMNIYQNGLGGGWQNASSAKAELAVEVAGSARKPIRVEAGPGQAVILRHAPIETKPYRKLGLLIQSMPPGGQDVRIIATSGGKAVAGPGKKVTLKPGGWTNIETSFESIGAEDATIDGFMIENISGQALPIFYVTDIFIE